MVFHFSSYQDFVGKESMRIRHSWFVCYHSNQSLEDFFGILSDRTCLEYRSMQEHRDMIAQLLVRYFLLRFFGKVPRNNGCLSMVYFGDLPDFQIHWAAKAYLQLSSSVFCSQLFHRHQCQLRQSNRPKLLHSSCFSKLFSSKFVILKVQNW